MWYKFFLRPLFFLFDPESVHHFVFKMIKLTHRIPGVGALNRKLFTINDKRLEREFFGLTFKNPVGIAAGFDKNATIFNELTNYGFGFLEIGTATPRSQEGNAKPRLFRLKKDQALINRMGFNNIGALAIAKRLQNRKTKLIIGGNIGKNTATPNENATEDYLECFNTLHDVVDYFVVNVSCPNVKGLKKLQDTEFLTTLLLELKRINNDYSNPKPILLKIAPDLNEDQLDEVIELVAQTNIDGIIATNTTTTREGLQMEDEKVAQIGNGGLSGKPLTDRSTEVIRYLATQSKKAFPIIGVGGIHSAQDALEKLDAGADLVQVYTGFIYEGPKLVKKINKSILSRY